MFKQMLIAVPIAVALATPAAFSASSQPVLHVLWSGDPTEDETSGAYDKETGLGTLIDCADVRGGKHVLTVQFSYSRATPALAFIADVEPKDTPVSDRPPVAHTLYPAENSWSYRRDVATCAVDYTIYVGYPSAAST